MHTSGPPATRLRTSRRAALLATSLVCLLVAPACKPTAAPAQPEPARSEVIQGVWTSYTIDPDGREVTLTLSCTYQGNEVPHHAEAQSISPEYVQIQVFVTVSALDATPCKPGPIGHLSVQLDQPLGSRVILQASRPIPQPR